MEEQYHLEYAQEAFGRERGLKFGDKDLLKNADQADAEMRKLNPNIHAHVLTEPEVKLAMIRKLEAELRNFKTDSEGIRSNLENAIKDLSSKLNEDNVKYLPLRFTTIQTTNLWLAVLTR